jgi:hypothetical protein
MKKNSKNCFFGKIEFFGSEWSCMDDLKVQTKFCSLTTLLLAHFGLLPQSIIIICHYPVFAELHSMGLG